MEIRRIKHYQTEEDFLVERCLLPIPSVVYCEETKELYFRKKTKLFPGQIVLWDATNSKRLYIMPSAYNTNDYPLAQYKPQGVVVIPEQFTPDGFARMISLKNMSASYPEAGTTDIEYLYWGNCKYENGSWQYEDIEDLTNFSNRPNISVTASGSESSNVNRGYLPSDSYHQGYANSEADNAADNGTHWYNGINGYRLPSPFNAAYEHNPQYGYGNGEYHYSFLSDLNGYANTQILIDREEEQPSWQTDNAITNSNAFGHSPAAICCARYYTDGTNAGDWYLPAIGELGCIMPRFSLIQAALQAIASIDSSLAVPLREDGIYWSSTEFGERGACILDTGYGDVDYYFKDDDRLVRAFCRLPRI